ncbi:hypothetical protein [Bradyrhizobium tunisiense]|uniref:hypothetical protein n=1 Tax=Bradyrhizobium tunisiense TaxID=3278709 RepID=UPI0035D8C500
MLEPVEFVQGEGFRAQVRRIEPSPSFRSQFGKPTCALITADHFLGKIIPIGRRMSRPTTVALTDLNGQRHEAVAEAFDTKRNILILLYPKSALSKTTIILPAGFKASA